MGELLPVTTYVTSETKERWLKHIQYMKDNNSGNSYAGLSHMLEDAVEYKIEADTMNLNKLFGLVGARKK